MAEFQNPALAAIRSNTPASEASQATDIIDQSINNALNQGSVYKPRGKATSLLSKDEYGIDYKAYPSDLMSSAQQYGSNYVVFYINVAEDSKLVQRGQVDFVQGNIPTKDQGSTVGLLQKYDTGNATTNGAQLGFASTADINALTSTASFAKADTVGKGIFGAAKNFVKVGAASSLVGAGIVEGINPGTTTGATKRIKTCIALHMPNNFAARYGVNYEEENLDVFAAGAATFGGANKAIQDARNDRALSDIAKESASAAGPAAFALGLSTPDKFGIKSTGGLQKAIRMAPNPRKEQLFKSVDFRTFQFTYEFYPRDEAEANEVNEIIYNFKLHMHPEFRDTNEFLYIYPSEFDIFYYHGTQENLNINRHTSCVLTDLTVNYSPQGQFTTFANGMPTQITVNMTFKELSLLTKEKIQDRM